MLGLFQASYVLCATGGSSLRDSYSGSGGLEGLPGRCMEQKVLQGSQTSFNTWVHELDLGQELVEVPSLHPGAGL